MSQFNRLSNTRKTIFVLISLFLITVVGFAGNNVYKRVLKPQKEEKVLTSPTDPLDGIFAVSPTAAAFAKYGDYPVSLHTGTPNISIPIHNVQYKDINVPISLSYHASGIKVNEIASWVGLGWTLNAGGVITRSVRNIPDEGNYNGIGFYEGMGNNSAFTPHRNNFDFRDSGDGRMDTEPDVFFFNFNGYSGKFVFDENNEIHVIPEQDIRIEPIIASISSNLIDGWVITLPNGVKYHFGDLDYVQGDDTREYTNSYIGGAPPTFTPIVSSWYLQEIHSLSNDKVQFEYEREIYSTTNLASESGRTVLGSACPSPPNTENIAVTDICGLRLSKIISESEEIDFLAFQQRDDVWENLGTYSLNIPNHINATGQTHPAKYLSEIHIKNKNNSCRNKFSFNHSYFNSIEVPYHAVDKTDIKRLKLNSVEKTKCNGTDAQVHTFSYDESIALPRRKSRGVDLWGYYNGKEVNNYNLIPGYFYTFLDQNNDLLAAGNCNGSDRDASEVFMKAGVLNRIDYPTGGYTEFEYEAHKGIIEEILPQYLQSFGSSCSTNPSDYDLGEWDNMELKDLANTLYSIDNVTIEVIASSSSNSLLEINYRDELVFTQQISQSISTFTFQVNLIEGFVFNIEKGSNVTATIHVKKNGIIIKTHYFVGQRGASNFVRSFSVDNLGNHPNSRKVVPDVIMKITGSKSHICASSNSPTPNQTGQYASHVKVLINENIPKNGSNTNMNLITPYSFGRHGDQYIPGTPSGVLTKYFKADLYENTYLNVNTCNMNVTIELISPNIKEEVEKTVGGLRIKSINSYDGLGNIPIIKNYEYEYDDGTTTGIVVGEPRNHIYVGHLGMAEHVNTITDSEGNHLQHKCDLTFQLSSSTSFSPEQTTQGSHIGYKQVKEFQVNNGYSIYEYDIELKEDYDLNEILAYPPTPELSLELGRGNLLKESHYAEGATTPQQEITYTYHHEVFKELNAMARENYRSSCPNMNLNTTISWLGNIPLGQNAYYVYGFYNFYKIQLGRSYLTEKKIIIDGIETKETYSYSPDYKHSQPIATQTINSDGTKHISRTKYVADYNLDPTQTYNDTKTQAIADLTANYQIHTPIESVQYIEKNGVEYVLGGSITTFKDFSGNTLPYEMYVVETASPILAATFDPAYVDNSGNFVMEPNYRKKGTIADYDNKGNLLSYQKEKDISTSVIWGHNQTLPTAKVINAESNEAAYTSFEGGDNEGNWLYSATRQVTTNPKTGKNAFNLGTGTIGSVTAQVADRTYTLSFWATTPNIEIYVGGVIFDNITTEGYNEIIINSTGMSSYVIVIRGTGLIDELRLYPEDALMSTYTYDDATRQLINMTDENNMIATFEYDDFQRLANVYDHEGNLISNNEYHYQVPNSTTNEQYNYIKNTTFLTAGKTAADIANLSTLPLSAYQQNVQYIDGLGRPIQTIAVKQSVQEKDIVQHIEYDEFGRAAINYMPFTTASLGGNYHTNALTKQNGFYSGQFSGTSFSSPAAFSETLFDGSPLNRPVEQGAPGYDWQIGSGHTMTTEYNTNTSTDAVKDYSRNTLYATQELIKQKVTDENGVPTWSFTDKLGRTILTRRQHTKDNGSIEYAETYTVYDDFGNVKIVIPPLAAKKLKAANTYSLTNVQDLIYKYRYDSRQRLIEKKIPSAEPQLFVYDALDRIVLTQDGNLRNDNKWQFTKYDILSRPVMSGIHTWRFSNGTQPVPYSANTTVAQQHQAIGPDGNPIVSSGSGTGDGLYGFDLYESRNQSTLGYTDNAFPNGTTIDPLSVTYYDNYNYDGNTATTDVSFKTEPEIYPTDVRFRRLKGKLTGTKVRILDQGNNWLLTTTFYDDRGRIIQTYGDNHLGGYDITSMEYDFAGKVLKSKRWHKVANQQETWTRSRYTYDHAGRVIQNKHKIKGQAEIILSQSVYNEVNQLIEKKLHSTNVSGSGYVGFLQNVDYKYNLRGWLTNINDLDWGTLTAADMADEIAAGLVNRITNQNIEIRMNAAEVNSGVYSEVEIEDESEYEEENGTVSTETTEEDRDIAQDGVFSANTLVDVIDLSRVGEVVNADNIDQALADIKTDLKAELINLGVTSNVAQDLVISEVETFYKNRWGSTIANDDDNDLYAQTFNYSHFTAANPQYNGNIAASTWRVKGKDKQHYEYSYDDMNRLRSADYHGIDELGNQTNINGYNMAASYDLNGNIQTMYRKGALTTDNNTGMATSFGIIDNMHYEYANNSNTLINIYETYSSTQLAYEDIKGFKGNQSQGGLSYTYDDNGNLITDVNKNITNITYNHLNLPNVITFGDGNTITWLYDAAGVKLQKATFTHSSQTTNTHDYIGGIEYQDNVIQAIYTDEGRAVPNGTVYRYEYSIKDHLGNSRVMFSDIDNDGIAEPSEIIQEEHYYPFGMKMEGYGRTITNQENFYQYNGKELNEDFGLDMYDYGARFYDAAVGRWFAIDPLAEKYVGFSPFNYVVNNPLIYIDPDGRNGEIIHKKGDANAEKKEDRKNTITVKTTLHWSPDTHRAFDEKGITNKYTTDPNVMNDIPNYWNDTRTVEINGVEYEVKFEIDIKRHETHEGAIKAWKNDPSSNFLIVNEAEGGNSNAGNGMMTLNLRQQKRGDGFTFTHELGHLFGIGHNSYKENGKSSVSSYDFNNRTVLSEDIKNVVGEAVTFVNNQNADAIETRMTLTTESLKKRYNTLSIKGKEVTKTYSVIDGQ